MPQRPPSTPAPAPGLFALVAGRGGAALADPSGRCETLGPDEAARRLGEVEAVVCHLPATAERLGRDVPALDILELFAFARPAEPCRPDPAGLAEALGLPAEGGAGGGPAALQAAARRLLGDLADLGPEDRAAAAAVARTMGLGGWRWAGRVLAALGAGEGDILGGSPRQAFEVWRSLPEWAESAPAQGPGDRGVTAREVRRRLAALVGGAAEDRPQQADYASAVSEAFAPRGDGPRAVLAEAGTGTGKTLGYLAPATLWAERNGAPVWVSTFTRNLQRQIDRELDRLHPDPAEKARRVVVRMGRESYLCLLNYEEALGALGADPANAVGLGLLARWAARTRGGMVRDGDLPGWLPDLVGRAFTAGLADRRGECVYTACRHYHKCYIEKAARLSRRADIVIANHALVLAQAAASGGGDDGPLSPRLVFDEGHHLFNAADGAFASRLGGRECAELGRWLTSPARGARRGARGLAARVGDAALLDDTAAGLLGEVRAAAGFLPGPGWAREVRDGPGRGAAERFLHQVRLQVYARNPGEGGGYGIETGVDGPPPALAEAAAALDGALEALAGPMAGLAARLAWLLESKGGTLGAALRGRVEGAVRALAQRAEDEVAAWRSMLRSLEDGTPEGLVEWLSVERERGADVDAAMHRRWLDPMAPFAERVLRPADGVVVTSATLRQGAGDVEADWGRAEERTGMAHLDARPVRARMPSPFDYPARTRVVVVDDVGLEDGPRIGDAYRELFLAAGGGALGLFTSVARLRRAHGLIAAAMEEAGCPLLAQHVDRFDAASLVEMFRADERSCLLGTDAMRDGIDVPGPSLRLVVFDRVPWPVPTILHRARRAAFGDWGYDNLIVRLRLKQAFGRLVRGAGDTGLFVMLDPRLRREHLDAFPGGVEVRRAALADAVAEARRFVGPA